MLKGLELWSFAYLLILFSYLSRKINFDKGIIYIDLTFLNLQKIFYISIYYLTVYTE